MTMRKAVDLACRLLRSDAVFVLALLAMALGVVMDVAAPPAHGQTALSNCSQTVSTSSNPVVFPATGSTGPTLPAKYLEICNAHATNTLGVNFAGGTASIGAVGTLTLNPGGCVWWNTPPSIPTAVSVIGSASGTTTACGYK